MPVGFVHVDAFTAEPYGGNPAAVVVLPRPVTDAWMQTVARELNLSETAFLRQRSDGGFDLRWFTPTVEVDLCGHATLASAHALWESGTLPETLPARFYTKSGLLTAARTADGIELDFPSTPPEPAAEPPGLAQALGVAARSIGRSRFDYLVELDSEDAVRRARPDFRALAALGVRGVIITSLTSTPGIDFVSRFFAPGSGVDEDPVTGSAHCCLTPFWSARLNKTTFTARQVSARGGLLKLRLDGDRVKIGGQAITVIRGELLE